ncbi:hypothetical protein FVEN_g9917 [Fusarium venenatum]|uniref:Uncharacterized protein n=1 Tax=Fusarium venenatum TaxID=56646 RepID=A0A2L2T684_9HYPO|nr:uncharacterized protein FVRRES_05037 [Fusarium venenatum]KAG8352016.1 hypothetical protein FVEN_g9917 [Fusarium venenatum]KAH6992163.1 hypothetical protein EDB82DRAFT_523267 [Fusarium venenatum]CEI60601.1 unnamed protein product [Fusarium venenatum]
METSSSTSTRSLTRTSGPPFPGDFINNTAQPDQNLRTPVQFDHTDLLVELDNRPGDSKGITHNTVIPGSLALTPESVASQLNSQNSNLTFATEVTDIGISGVDEGGLIGGPRSAVYKAHPNIPTALEELPFGSSSDFWNAFDPEGMSPAEFERHMEDIAREIQRRAPPPPLDLNSGQGGYSARLTFANGYTSREIVVYNGGLKYNFVSQSYLNKLRTASGQPPCFIPGPPTYEEVLTPDGTSAPIRYLVFADLQWESPNLPFPSGPQCFVPYRGNGGIHDARLVLGRSWFNGIEEQALNRI